MHALARCVHRYPVWKGARLVMMHSRCAVQEGTRFRRSWGWGPGCGTGSIAARKIGSVWLGGGIGGGHAEIFPLDDGGRDEFA